MTVIYNMSIDRADKPWIGDRRLTEQSLWAAGSAAAKQSRRLDGCEPIEIAGCERGSAFSRRVAMSRPRAEAATAAASDGMEA
jgi:hypothetical protein